MRIVITIIAIAFSLSLSAQTVEVNSKDELRKIMVDNAVNFYDVVDAGEAFFNTLDKNAKGSGYKPFMRWINANEYKYYPDGDRTAVDPYFVQKQYSSFLKNNGNQKAIHGTSWKDLGPYTIDNITGHYAAGLGRVEDFYVSPIDSNIIYLGSRSGGFWRTTDGGTNWAVTTDFLTASGVNAMSVSPTNSDSVLINVRNAVNGTSHGVYESSDGGLTWSATAFNPSGISQLGLGNDFQVFEIAHHPTIKDLIFVGTNRGIFRSTDNLATWTASQFNFDFTEIAFHPTKDSVMYLYSRTGSNVISKIFISRDFGVTYTLSNTVTSSVGSTFSVELATSPQCPDCVWFACSNGVWISTDEGVNFTFRSNSTQNCRGFAVNDLDSANMVYGYVDLDNSTDGGRTFVNRTRWSLGNTNGNTTTLASSYATSTNYIHADVRNLKSVNGNFYAATDGFLCKSSDGGVNWTILSEGTGIRENYKLGVSQSNYHRNISGSQDNGTSILTENGWIEFYGADGMEGIIHPLNEDWMMGSVQYGSRRLTKDGGLSSTGASPAGSSQAYWEAPLAIDPNDHMVVYDFRSEVWKSDDFTETYAQLSNPSGITGNIEVAEIAQNNSDIMVIAKGSSILKSTDGGASFSSIRANLPFFSVRDIAIDPNNDDVMIVVYARYQADNSKVWLTTNGGTSWTNITNNLGSMPVRSVVIDHSDSSNIYVGAEIGVYTMPMGGSNWSLFSSGLPNVAVRELEIMNGSNTLRAATWGRGLWEHAIVGRENYPAITYTTITDPPTNSTPKFGKDQFVTAQISYAGSLSSVYLEWSRDSAVFGNVISMSNTVDSTWESATALPQLPVGTKVYFKVFAVGAANDTTETYKFMYEVTPFEYCTATGNTSSGNLYLSNVRLENLNNFSVNTNYTLYNNPVVDLYADSTYTLSIAANTSWSANDFSAWIDYNNDANFTPAERIHFAANNGLFSIQNFTVPSNVNIGDTVLMRVRLSYWGSTSQPCGDQFGEVEDYLVVLRNTTTSINEVVEENEFFRLYPNPNNGAFTIEFKAGVQEQFVRVFSSVGQLVAEQNQKGRAKINFDLELPNGTYFITVGSDVQVKTIPMIISE